jgi:hypothetical protein
MRDVRTMGDVDWSEALLALWSCGWARLAGALPPLLCDELFAAAPATWVRQPDELGVVQQGGQHCGAPIEQAPAVLGELVDALAGAIDAAAPAGCPPLPRWNEAEWNQDDDGTLFITQHRDPPLAGGTIAVLTLAGSARFRVWDDDGAHEWDTGPGDVVLMAGQGWPTPQSTCPLHEAESPGPGGRRTLTLRHHLGGAGAAWFPEG